MEAGLYLVSGDMCRLKTSQILVDFLHATRWQLCMEGAHSSLQHRNQRDGQREKTTMERCFMFAGEAAHLADQADRELLGEDI